jgi:hypothetical protein
MRMLTSWLPQVWQLRRDVRVPIAKSSGRPDRSTTAEWPQAQKPMILNWSAGKSANVLTM